MISAYKKAAKEVLEKSVVIEKYQTQSIEISFGFEQMSWVMKNIKASEAEIIDQIFDAENIRTSLKIVGRKSLIAGLLESLQGVQGVEIS